MLVYILLAIVALLALWVLYGLTQPKVFSVKRSATFKAAPAAVYGELADFHRWSAWSPWEKMDPNMRRVYSGAKSGVGAKYAWEGNKKVGKGSMEITKATSPGSIVLDLHFMAPFVANNITEFTITPQGKGSTLEWEMRGAKPFMFRMMGLFINMDKVVGKDFEQGLENLRKIVEA